MNGNIPRCGADMLGVNLSKMVTSRVYSFCVTARSLSIILIAHFSSALVLFSASTTRHEAPEPNVRPNLYTAFTSICGTSSRFSSCWASSVTPAPQQAPMVRDFGLLTLLYLSLWRTIMSSNYRLSTTQNTLYLGSLPTLPDNKQIQFTILSMDESFCCSSDGSNGCTIVFALVRPGGDDKYDIRVFWAGDSRAVLIGEDGFEQLTQDHRPDNPSEMARIEEAKGVIINNRVDSKLAVSRAFGDMNLKNNKSLEWEKQRVTALTEYRVARAASSDVLFLFCDGLVEYLDNAQLIGRFNSHLVEYEDPVYGLGYLFDEILDGGSRDNMSAIIIYFRAAKDYGLNGKHKTFLPGPLYLTRNDKKYVDAYLRNAKDFGHEDSPKLRRAAYREDLKLLKKYGTQGTGYSKSIMYQIEEVIREIDNTSSDNHNTTDHEMDGSTEVIERSPTPPLSDVDAEFLEHKEETQTMKRNHSMVVTPSPSPTNKETSNRKRTFANLNENNNDTMQSESAPKRRKSNIGDVIKIH
eukprot:922538_1